MRSILVVAYCALRFDGVDAEFTGEGSLTRPLFSASRSTSECVLPVPNWGPGLILVADEHPLSPVSSTIKNEPILLRGAANYIRCIKDTMVSRSSPLLPFLYYLLAECARESTSRFEHRAV
jgi:hypothetical protein